VAENFKWTRKHLLGLRDLSRREIEYILDAADSFGEVNQRLIKKVPALRGKVVVHAHSQQLCNCRRSIERGCG